MLRRRHDSRVLRAAEALADAQAGRRDEDAADCYRRHDHRFLADRSAEITVAAVQELGQVLISCWGEGGNAGKRECGTDGRCRAK